MNWKTILKAGLSVLILFLVLRSIDRKLLLEVLTQANPLWLLWALAWYVFSKIIGAFRFNDLLKSDGITMGNCQQLQLYWLGMYYNLLLPGGISGDGYKIKRLMDEFGRPFRRLFSITLYDRVSGMLALGQICLLLALGLPAFQPYWYLWLAGVLLSVPASKLLFDRMVGGGKTAWRRTTLQSAGVQLAQLVSVLGVVFALNEPAQWLGYSVIFLVSSVVAMLPLTIGGAGARELTFLWGARVLHLAPERSVAIAFVFYLVATAVSLFGMKYIFTPLVLQPKSPSTVPTEDM